MEERLLFSSLTGAPLPLLQQRPGACWPVAVASLAVTGSLGVGEAVKAFSRWFLNSSDCTSSAVTATPVTVTPVVEQRAEPQPSRVFSLVHPFVIFTLRLSDILRVF